MTTPEARRIRLTLNDPQGTYCPAGACSECRAKRTAWAKPEKARVFSLGWRRGGQGVERQSLPGYRVILLTPPAPEAAPVPVKQLADFISF